MYMCKCVQDNYHTNVHKNDRMARMKFIENEESLNQLKQSITHDIFKIFICHAYITSQAAVAISL